MDGFRRTIEAASTQELSAAYARWAADYDRDTLAMGYCLPWLVSAFLARHVERGAGPLLDVGCGTGLAGPALAALGYDRIDGLDLSEEMLAIAASRGTYRELHNLALGRPLPWADGHFAAVFSAGVFGEGHASADAFDELVRITRPGGALIFTVRESHYEPGGFARKFAGLTAEGAWQCLEQSPAFREYLHAQPEMMARAWAFRRAEA